MNVKRESLEVRKRSIFSSSAESLESFDDSLSITTQEQLYDNIRLHKEIIQSVKLQPWSLSKKYKIVQRAKQYVAKHEDTLQERFAQSGNTKDLYARFKIVLADVRELTFWQGMETCDWGMFKGCCRKLKRGFLSIHYSKHRS